MKRTLEPDSPLGTPISTGFDEDHEVDSPSKRSRSTPPPTLAGPLYFTASGQLAPRNLPPKFCAMPGVRRLLPRPVPVKLAILGKVIDTDLSTFLASTADKVVFIFENANFRAPQQLVSIPQVAAAGVIVSDEPPSVHPQIPFLLDQAGELARECRVTDPLGGGSMAAPCLVYVKNREVVSTILLGRPIEDIYNVINSW